MGLFGRLVGVGTVDAPAAKQAFHARGEASDQSLQIALGGRRLALETQGEGPLGRQVHAIRGQDVKVEAMVILPPDAAPRSGTW